MTSAILAVFALSLLSGQTADPAGASAVGPMQPRIEAFLETCETARRGAIVRLEHELRGLRSQRSSTAEAVRRIAKIEANLATLRAGKEPVVPALKFPPEVGAIGRLPRLSCHVERVLTDNEMLVRCAFSLKVRTVRHYQARYETVVRNVTFLLRGLPTREMHEGSEVELVEVFEITGTHTYQSALGQSITVQVLAPFDMKTIEPYFRSRAAPR